MTAVLRRTTAVALALPLGLGLGATAAAAAPKAQPGPLAPLAAKAKAQGRTAKSVPADLPPVSWKDCPGVLPPGVPTTAWCNLLITTGGQITMGGITQPLTKPMTITQLVYDDPATGENVTKIVKVRSPKLRVPGGVLGLPGSDDTLPLLKLEAQPQVDSFGLDFTNWTAPLSMRVKAINPVLGDKCFIGTKAKPIALNLKIDTAKLEVIPTTPELLKVVSADDSFAVPAAKGCGVLDPIVNFRAKLPSPAGKNSAQLVSYMVGKPYSQLKTAAARR